MVYSRKGYIKRMSADTFTVQAKGGRGERAVLRCARRGGAGRRRQLGTPPWRLLSLSFVGVDGG